MKILYLIRHGKAVGRKEGQPDLERVLIKRGENDALLTAQRLEESGAKPDLIFSSPAARALATARIVARHFKYTSKTIRTRRSIYEQPAGVLLNLVQGLGGEYDQVFLVGHDPALTDLAGLLLPDFHRDLPTGSVVGIRFELQSWSELSTGIGQLELFHFPGAEKENDRGRMFVENLEYKLSRAILDLLKEIDGPAAVKLDKLITQSAALIARKFDRKFNSRRRKKSSSQDKKKRTRA